MGAQAAAEEQLRQAKKLEAVGRLAAGIAHDFNNLLSAVLSCAEQLLDDMPAEAAGREEVAENPPGGRTSRRVDTPMAALWPPAALLAPKVLDFNSILDSSGAHARRVVGEDIELGVVPGAQLGSVNADPGQIEQVLASSQSVGKQWVVPPVASREVPFEVGAPTAIGCVVRSRPLAIRVASSHTSESTIFIDRLPERRAPERAARHECSCPRP